MNIIHKIEKFIKDIKYVVVGEKLDIDDIPPMRYPKGEEEKRKNFVNPFKKYNSNSRIRYKR